MAGRIGQVQGGEGGWSSDIGESLGIPSQDPDKGWSQGNHPHLGDNHKSEESSN